MRCFGILFCSTVPLCHCTVPEVDKKTLLSTVRLKARQYIYLIPMPLIKQFNETLPGYCSTHKAMFQ